MADDALAGAEEYVRQARETLAKLRDGRGLEVQNEIAERLLVHQLILHQKFLEAADLPMDHHTAKALADLHRAYKELAQGVWDRLVLGKGAKGEQKKLKEAPRG
jgi:hypothetical protein